MAMRFFFVNFEDIANQTSARLDPKYRYFWDIEKGFLFDGLPYTKLGNLISEIHVSKFRKGELDETKGLMSIPNQVGRSARIQNIEDIVELDSDKNPLHDADIIISKLGLPKGLIFYNDKECENLIGSSEFIPYKLINPDWNAKFLTYLLLLPKVLKKLARLESGKTPSHKRVNPFDLLNVKIPIVSRGKQQETAEKIEPIEREIENLQAQIGEPTGAINRVFAREFFFDENLWFEFGRGMTAGTQKSRIKESTSFLLEFQDFAKSNLLRFSTRFHNPITQKLYEILHSSPTIKVEQILLESIHRGKQPIVDESGTVYAIKTGQLKNKYIDLESCEFVSENFFEKSPNAQIRKGDVLLASTGKVSLGKIDLADFDDDIQAVADGHLSILRINENLYNKQFFVFFLRSILGVFQVERDYTGATNQIELYASEIEKFDIPDISLNAQEKIVNEIQSEFSAQDKIKRRIEDKRKEIDHIIERVLS